MSLDIAALFSLVGYVIVRVFALSLLVQLALESLYRWSGFTVIEDAFKRKVFGIGLRWPVAMALSTWLGFSLKTEGVMGFDAFAELFDRAPSWSGIILTAMAVTGGTAPFLAAFAKIEAIREKAKTIISKQQEMRSGTGNGGAK